MKIFFNNAFLLHPNPLLGGEGEMLDGNPAKFLYDAEKTETVNENFTKLEQKKIAVKTETGKDLLKTEIAVTAKNKGEVDKKVIDKEKTSVANVTNSAKLNEEDEKKELNQEKEDVENISKEFVKNKKIAHSFKTKILDKKYGTPEEFSAASREFMEGYSSDYLKYVEKSAIDHPYLKEHWKLIPNDLENTAKISAALFALGGISHEGGMKDSFLKGGSWAIWGAVLTHPIVTGAIAHGLKIAGKPLVKITGFTMSMITEFIYNPGKFYREAKRGKIPGSKEKFADALMRSQEPLALRMRGMDFSPELNSVLDFMISSPQPKEIPLKIRENSAKFLAQTATVASKFNPEQVDKWEHEAWNKEISDENLRKLILVNSRQTVQNFFKLKPKFEQDLKVSLKDAQAKLKSTDKDKLKEIGIDDLTKIVGVGNGNLAETIKEKKHGIRRALSNMSGTSLIAYILIWLTTKGVMFGSKLWHKGLDKTKNFRDKSTKEKLKSVGKGAWKGVWYLPNKVLSLIATPFGLNPKQRARKAVRYWGESGGTRKKSGGPLTAWTSEQSSAYKSLKNKEKNSVAQKFAKKMDSEREGYEKKLKELKKKYKDKKPSFWKVWKWGTRRTERKEFEGDAKVVNDELKNIELNPEEWKSLFSGIKSSNEKVYKVLFPD